MIGFHLVSDGSKYVTKIYDYGYDLRFTEGDFLSLSLNSDSTDSSTSRFSFNLSFKRQSITQSNDGKKLV